jgi:hypothetical protein
MGIFLPATSVYSRFCMFLMTAIMNSICSRARTRPSFARSYIFCFARGLTFRYIPPTRGLEGCTASPPAIMPMDCPISRMRMILAATLRTGCSLVNGLIFVSVPGI